jgi:hypothetical protein
VTQLKEERFEGKKLNLAELKRVVGGRKVLREEEDRSLSMASLWVKGMKMKGKRRRSECCVVFYWIKFKALK